MPKRIAAACLAAAALALSLLAGCGGGTEVRFGFNQPLPQPSGFLIVTIGNLPGGADAAVRVTGPGGFARDMPRSGTLSGLPPGTYTVIATPVAVGHLTYTPSPGTQDIAVTGGATASVTIRYAAAPLSLGLATFASGLSNPVFLTAPPGDPRQFIVEREGRIRVVKDGSLLAAPFLDIGARVSAAGEGGLLSMAFDPGYRQSGAFYVYYTAPTREIVVERYTVSGNPDLANPASALEVIRIPHPVYLNHFGGLVAFGPDGYLYLATGDGGGAGDPAGNAQNNAVLLGKVLRLDVGGASAVAPYRIPPSNPFIGQPGARAEIWALGLRNPWRFTFDAGRIYIADVGQDQREEVNIASDTLAGLNYGWDIMEGSLCTGTAGCSQSGLVLPAFEYAHGTSSANGCSVVGGHVYRGSAIPELAGHYFYSDYCAGFLRSFLWNGTQASAHNNWAIPYPGNVVSFGQDASGELYLVSEAGTVYKIVRAIAPAP